MNYSATVLGSGSVLESYLIKLLIKDDSCEKVHLPVKQTRGWRHHKINETEIDLERDVDYGKCIRGDVLFSCLCSRYSTKQYFLDSCAHTLKAAKAASQNGVPHHVMLSTSLVQPLLGNSYGKLKRELERTVKSLKFESVVLLRPSGILEDKPVHSTIRRISRRLMLRLYVLLPALRKYKPIETELLSQAMLLAFKRSRSSKQKLMTYDRSLIEALVDVDKWL